MDVVKQTVEIYETEDGVCPFDEWITGIRDKRTRAIACGMVTLVTQRQSVKVSTNFASITDLGSGSILEEMVELW